MARLCALLAAFLCLGDALPPVGGYADCERNAVKIGDALYEALSVKDGNRVNIHPLCLKSSDQPYIALLEPEGKRATGEVCISQGMIDFLDHVAHAKAADRANPGFFDHYVKSVTTTAAGTLILPEISDARFWTVDVRNRQMSLFNQMVGMVTAINLSHYYLGHYAKYARNLAGAPPRSINQFLRPAEWEASVKAGAINSMICALASEGASTLFDALGEMPQRPAWSVYLVPSFADLNDLNRELARYETNFYHGSLGDENTR
jgi:hypothetical protein